MYCPLYRTQTEAEDGNGMQALRWPNDAGDCDQAAAGCVRGPRNPLARGLLRGMQSVLVLGKPPCGGIVVRNCAPMAPRLQRIFADGISRRPTPRANPRLLILGAGGS